MPKSRLVPFIFQPQPYWATNIDPLDYFKPKSTLVTLQIAPSQPLLETIVPIKKSVLTPRLVLQEKQLDPVLFPTPTPPSGPLGPI